jgi:hypothetical protein
VERSAVQRSLLGNVFLAERGRVVDGPEVSPRNKLDVAFEVAIMELLAQRGPGKTICPSEAARLLDPSGWKELMDKARAAAGRLVAQGEIVVTQRGKIVDPSEVKGPIRLKIR